jgi:hypothetical protein
MACGPPKGINPTEAPKTSQPRTLAPRPVGEVFILEASGVQPEDTVVSTAAGARRVVVLRRSAPDYGVFTRVEFPEAALSGAAGATVVSLTIRPRPGIFGLDLSTDGVIGDGAVIRFSYGAHFVAPAGARNRYGSNIAFEKELAIGKLSEDGRVVFLPTSRPGSDILSAPLPGPGRYLVAAPR